MTRQVLPIRHQVTAMLAQPGVKQSDIAKALGCSLKTVSRIAQQVKPAIAEADSRLTALNKEIATVISVKQRAEKYAKLATSAKNEAVSLGALQRIDDLDGIVTDKERLRAKQVDPAANQRPIFVFQGGMNIDFGGAPTPQDMVSDSTIIEHGAVSDTKQTER